MVFTMRKKKSWSGRGRGGSRGGGRRGRRAGEKPPSDRRTGVYYKLLKDPNAMMQTSHQAKRFLEGMAAMDSKAKLLADLTDPRNSGRQRIEQVLSFLEDAGNVQDFLIPLLRHGINDETSRPLYKSLRDKYLHLIFRVPLLMAFLGSEGVIDKVDKETADFTCLFLLYVAKAHGEARASDDMSTVAKKLRDRGDVKDVGTLCSVLLVDEKSRLSSDKASSDSMRSSRDGLSNEVACWVSDRVPPGGRHDNDALNYRDIEVVPTADELRCQVPPFLPLASGENKIIDDPVMHLLDSNFRLLREDAVSSMRESISQRKWPWKNARVVGLDLNVFGSSGSICFIVQVDPPSSTIPDWNKARALMQGTVVAFLDTDAQLVRTGIITIHRDDESWLRNVGGPKFGVSFGTDSAFDTSMDDMVVNKATNESYTKLLRNKGSSQRTKDLLCRMKTFEMIEASRSFFAYQPVLKALQSMDRIPFTRELVELRSQHSDGPTYLPNTVNFPRDDNFNGYNCNLLGIPSAQDMVDNTSLDISQAKAVCQALTSRVSLIQGPPGCGKTFIGGLIAQIILSNSSEKIFCVCYTNHALDQFLEHMIDYGETRIVRIGGRSKSDKVAKYQLHDLAKTKARLNDQVSARIRQLDAQSYKQKDIINDHVAVLETPVGWDSPNGGVKSILEDDYPDEYDFLSLPKADDGFTVVGPSGSKGVAKDFLWNAWKGGESYPNFLLAHREKSSEDFENFWKMHQNQRLEFVGAIERKVTTVEGTAIRSAAHELSVLSLEKQELRQEKDLQILRHARVIGATTSGAARYRELISAIAPGVVIVEEAGEVLEAHVLSALSTETNETKHLVLIGDHKQLRPKVESYALSTASRGGYNLDISLFERLVLGSLPSSRLAVQHRMRPEISRFIRAQTYNDLIDHQSVFKHPDLKGVYNNVVFIDHTMKEDGEDTYRSGYQSNTTKSNTYEATVCVEIVRFFLLQGYGADRIVVLTPYLGQLRKILSVMKTSLKDVEAYITEQDLLDLETLDEDPSRELKSQSKGKPRRSNIRVSSIDNFQGEENDIVIISLVRSNLRGEIGFLKEEQRVNVLLSRARLGMYLVGNSSTLLQSPGGRSTWGPIIDMLKEFGQLKRGLPTVCQLHAHDETIVLCTPEEFRTLRPNGGCLRKCDFRLPCGHVCPQMCHPTDRSHEYARSVCHEPCMRVPPECKMGHRCTKLCKFDCGPCQRNVGPMELTCGHVAKIISCHDARTPEALGHFASQCKEQVEIVIQACGHKVETFCGNARSETPTCPAKCGKMMACNHPCEIWCGQCSDDDHKCGVKCERYLFCGHVCKRSCHLPEGCKPCTRPCTNSCIHSTCPRKCREACASCVQACDWECKHQGKCELVCGAPCVRLPCNKRCTKRLKCGHQCPSVCGEDCPSAVYCAKCGNTTFLARVVDLIMFETYADHDLDTDPVLFLPCGHFFSMTTLDGLIGIDRAYGRREGVSDGDFLSPLPLIGTDVSEKAVQCPDCRSAIHSVRRYARITKFASLRSLERKHLMGVDEALDGFATKPPAERNIQALLQVRKTVLASPMRQVSDACGTQLVEVPSPPVRPLIRCAQLLGEAFATKSEELNDTSFERAIFWFEDAVQLATESKSMRSEAALRIALVQFLMKWLNKEPDLNSRCEQLLHPVLQLQDGFADDLVNQAKQLMKGLSDKDLKMIVYAMNQIEGYNYGGGASSHWYQCPNGHPYYIGNCGGAMERSHCLECGEVVGGANHRLQSTNSQWTGLGGYSNATT